jgi:hypothetical protein
MNLRQLTNDQEAILAQVENGDFTLDDVSDHLDMLEEDRNKKIENYLYVINRLDSEAASIKSEVMRLEKIGDKKLDALVNIKNWLLMSMKDGEKHDFDLFKVSRVKGREVLQINDGDKINVKYKECKPESWSVDKRAVLKDLKAGIEIEGAEIATGNPSLRIK